MMGRSRQQGFTLIELAIVAGLVVISTLLVSRGIGAMFVAYEYDRAFKGAQQIARVADTQRRRVSGSVPGGGVAPTTYTYRGYAAWTPVTTLNTALGTSMQATTPWGSAYEVRTTQTQALVRYEVPSSHDPIGRILGGNVRQTTLPGGAVLVEVATLSAANDRMGQRNAHVRAIYQEEVR